MNMTDLTNSNDIQFAIPFCYAWRTSSIETIIHIRVHILAASLNKHGFKLLFHYLSSLLFNYTVQLLQIKRLPLRQYLTQIQQGENHFSSIK